MAFGLLMGSGLHYNIQAIAAVLCFNRRRRTRIGKVCSFCHSPSPTRASPTAHSLVLQSPSTTPDSFHRASRCVCLSRVDLPNVDTKNSSAEIRRVYRRSSFHRPGRDVRHSLAPERTRNVRGPEGCSSVLCTRGLDGQYRSRPHEYRQGRQLAMNPNRGQRRPRR